MIGLGSNRLSVCRRGGMSVTQAGKGGMEWLGVRAPLWAQWWLPYSRQAGEALKAQFPTQWPTIRDYGFAHPEYINAINLYAPTDPQIMYSFIPAMGDRWLIGNGAAMIDTKVKATNIYEMEIKFKVDNPRNTWNAIFGASLPWSNTSAINFAAWAHGTNNNANLHTRIGANAGTDWSAIVGTTIHTMKVNLQGIYLDGVKVGTPARMWDIPTTMGLFMYINSSTPDVSGETLVGRIAYCELRDQNGKVISKPCPVISSQGIAMMDAVSADYLPKIGSGSFTISETPSS